MKTIQLFQCKDSISREMPFFEEENQLNSLNDLMTFDLINTEKVTEFIVEIPDDFVFENTNKDELLLMCKEAKETIDHYFNTVSDGYSKINAVTSHSIWEFEKESNNPA
ncbi:hypothetical protein [Chryseobacterium sp. ERMR1:04]|uniref:hypothetical protein n=1 Tax=Chryseobacterium sp. ERMR1:04 TaxID=1705393 RepID=UPI0008DCD593|nr:hypothetical protein [Chryseobacterium sp. ERMR1:04]